MERTQFLALKAIQVITSSRSCYKYREKYKEKVLPQTNNENCIIVIKQKEWYSFSNLICEFSFQFTKVKTQIYSFNECKINYRNQFVTRYVTYDGKVKSSQPSLYETRDKRPLGRHPDRSWCHRHTTSMIKLFWSQSILHGMSSSTLDPGPYPTGACP